MQHAHTRLGSLIGAIAFLTTATPAFSQSRHTAVSDDGSVGAPIEASASPGGATTSAAPSAGARRVTELALIAEGVFFDAESRAEFQRLSALPDGGEGGLRTGESGAEVIIGMDTRERLYTTTYPSRAKVLITFTGGRCSGTMIGPNTVATAGHCVHTGGSAGAWRPRASFQIYPGRNGTASPYGVCTARALYSVTGWTTSANEEYRLWRDQAELHRRQHGGLVRHDDGHPDKLPEHRRRLPGRQATDAVAGKRPCSRSVDAPGVLPERHDRRHER